MHQSYYSPSLFSLMADTNGSTPLHWLSRREHVDISLASIKITLACSDVRCNCMPSAMKENDALLKPFHGLFLKFGHFEKSCGFPYKLIHKTRLFCFVSVPLVTRFSLHGTQSVAEQQRGKNSRNLSFFLSVCSHPCLSNLYLTTLFQVHGEALR